MVRPAQSPQTQPHEIDLQQRRLERESEERKLDRLKAQLRQAKEYQQQIARAS